MLPLRIDPEQRFSCSQCGRCCHRWEVVVSQAEVESYRKQDAARWFREDTSGPDGAAADPFEAIAAWPGFHRIRKRADGACGFLSAENRCRIHEQLGPRQKPLTCRLFPYRFHAAPDAVIVRSSFGCPTIVANSGERISSGSALDEIKTLRKEWYARHPIGAGQASALVYIRGRSIEPGSMHVLRSSLLQMLDHTAPDGTRDLRANVLRMALALDDLTRPRVVRLRDDDFAEYVSLTVPHAASGQKPVDPRPPSRLGRLLQRGFLFLVAATRLRVEKAGTPATRLRLQVFGLAAHVHGLAPRTGRVNMGALRRMRVDVNDPHLQPLVRHYLRASIETLGTGERPVLDEFAIAVSYLNAACALAVMNAAAAGVAVDRQAFSGALMEAVYLTHSDDRGLLGANLARFAAGVDALYSFASG